MKKRKILVLFPFLGLLLSGCTFQEALDNVKNWTNGHIIDPIKDLINGGGKEEQPGGDEGGGDKPAEVTIKRIRVESCPTEVAVNYVFKTSEVSIKVFYSDGTEEVVEPETVRCDTSTPGDSTLYVTYRGFESDYPVRVLSEEEIVHVETITVESRFVNDMHVGDTYTIQVTVLPSDATNKAVTFASENEELAKVSADGVVTAVGAGVVKVNIASVDTPSVTNWVQFTIAEVAAGLPASTKAGYTKLAAGEELKTGEKVNFAGAIGEKYYAMPNYTSGNNIKAKEVSTEDGKLVIEDIAEDTTTFTHEFTAINNGDGTYSFMQADGNYLSASSTSSSNILKAIKDFGDTAKFNIVVDEAGYAQLTCPTVERGNLRLNGTGDNVLFNVYKSKTDYESIALYHDGKGSTEHVDVESIAFGKTAYSMEEGDSLQLSVNVLPALATNKKYSLTIQSAQPEGCVTLSGNTVTAVSQGTAVILAKSDENAQITATATITVTEHIERNYGSLENPLSIAEAKALIDLDGGTAKQEMYVKGEVSKNDAYNTSYKNTNIWLKDGADEFELYGAILPEGFEPAQPAKNDAALVGKIVVAHGMGKIYGSTYEFDKNCHVDSVKDNDTPVESVSLDRNELNMEVGMPDETLVATVLPADAGNKKVIWESSNPEVATVNEGVVHAVAAGDAIITVKSDADNEKTASCTVHVTQPEKQLTGIEVTTMPQVAYTEGDLLDLSGMVVTLHYDDQSSAEITSGWTTNIAADHELTLEDTSLVVSYGGFSADAIALTITAKPQPTHAGTAEDPYTIHDCEIVYANAKLEQGKDIGAEIYVTGTILADPAATIASGRGRLYIGDSSSENSLYIYNINNIGGSANLTLDDIPAGSTVLAKGTLKNYNGMQLCYVKDVANCEFISIVKPVVPVTGISLDKNELEMEVGMPDETLVATIAPENATNKEVLWESSDAEVATVTGGVVHAVAAGDAVITAKSAADESILATCSVHVKAAEKVLTGIEVTTMPQVAYTEGDLLDLSDMVVTLHYNDQSSAEITSGWTTNIAADHELTLEDTSLVVSYGGFDATAITLTITAKPQPTHAGTAEDPYTIHDCEIVYANAKLEQGKDLGAEIYVAGTILADPAATINNGRGRLYIGDSSSENSLYIYNINNIGGSNNLTLADIPAGSEVVAKGTLKNYNGMQLCFVANVANCEFISIVKPVIAPETVTITSGSELAVGSNMNLAATVGPEGAAQDVEWTIVTGGDYATLSDGVLTGVAAGEVTVKATAVGYENVYAEKTITVSSSVVPTEQAIYTLDGTVTGGSSGYAEASAITQSGVEWAVVGNTTMNPWRIGGKNLSGENRTVTCKSAFSDDITKVVVSTGTKTLSAVNSITLLVGTTEGASDVDSIQLTSGLVSANLEYARPEGHSWANCYFTVVFNVNAAGSNQYIQLNSVTLYAMK